MPRITIPAAGLGKLAASIVGGQSAYDQGMEQGITAQSKIAQALASIRANDATADLNAAKAEAEREALNRQSAGAVRDNAMTRFNVPLQERDNVDSFLNTGRLGGKYEAVPDELGGGPSLPAPAYAKDLGDVARAISGMNEAITLGDKSVENLAKAEDLRRNSRLSDAIIAGTADRNRVGGAQAAVSGKDLYTANEFGSTDKFTGAVDDSNAPAQRFAQYRGAQTAKEKEQAGAARANAVQSYASADASRASAAKTRQETELGGKGTLQQTDQGLLLVDTRTGKARAVIGPDGKPAGAKPSGAGGLNENQSNALNFANRMNATNKIFDELEKEGVRRPGLIKSAAEGVAGAVPLIGESLSAGASAATNWTQSDKQQQVEQAQRDFINAVLRRESGAAISSGEFANGVKQYFPALGDSEAVIRQKRANRERAMQGILAAVPESMRKMPGEGGGASSGWGGPKDAPAGTAQPSVSNW